jgi:predicted secreted protein
MSQAFAGYNGKIYISNDGGSTYNAIGEVNDMTLSIKTDDMEATSFDSVGWKEFIPGLKEWEADTEALYLYTNTGQDNLYNALVAGSVLKLRLLPKTGTGNKGYQGDAFITEWEFNNKVDDVVSLSASFRGTSSLTTYTAS